MFSRQTFEDFINKNMSFSTEKLGAMSTPELDLETHFLYRVQKSKEKEKKKNRRVQRRSISNAVIETGLQSILDKIIFKNSN